MSETKYLNDNEQRTYLSDGKDTLRFKPREGVRLYTTAKGPEGREKERNNGDKTKEEL
jgi:hypothetical protein